MQLTQVKLQDICIVDNLSRANDEHTEEEIRGLADKIILNSFWDPPDVRRNRKRLELIAGHLRIEAAKLLESENRLPAVAGDKNGVWVLIHEKTDAARDALNAAENIVRKNLSTYQTAHTLFELQNRYHYDARTMATQFGLDRKTVANYIRAARDLTPEIQHAWLNFDRSQTPIGLTKLIAWAGLPPDEQNRQFEVSKWGRIYKMVDAQLEKKSLRSRRDIETAIANASSLQHIEALEWVLRKRETLNGVDDAGKRSSRNDRGGRNRNDGSPPTSSAPNGHGSRRPASVNRSLLRQEQGRSDSSGPSAAESSPDSISGPYEASPESIYPPAVDAANAGAKRTARNPRGE